MAPPKPLASILDTSIHWYDEKKQKPQNLVTPDSIWSPVERLAHLNIHGSDSGFHPQVRKRHVHVPLLQHALA
ncbi:MAG: hypothetical protein H8E21_17040 [Gammaproteobacteria bacterium]|nr:hypothetical protein [Gammaproteobacteria bacterium]